MRVQLCRKWRVWVSSLKQTKYVYLEIQTALQNLLLNVPNIPHPSVPVGVSEQENIEVRQVGVPALI